MKAALVVLALLITAGSAWAQSGGHIGLYSDSPGYSDCDLNEQLYVFNHVYVIHSIAAEGNTSQFRVQSNLDMQISDVTFGTNLYLGDIFTGVTVTYVGCKPLPHLLATISYVPVRPAGPCLAMQVLPDPALPSGKIEIIDCSNNLLYATGGTLCVGTPYSCCLMCSHGEKAAACQAAYSDCYPVAVENSTWSQVKALYR